MKTITCERCGNQKRVDNTRKDKRYCSNKCRWNLNELGQHVDSKGFLKYPGKRNQGYVHRIVIENHLGRKLKADERVYHINGDKLDNRLENLALSSPDARLTKKSEKPRKPGKPRSTPEGYQRKKKQDAPGRPKIYPEGCREAAKERNRVKLEQMTHEERKRHEFLKKVKRAEQQKKYQQKRKLERRKAAEVKKEEPRNPNAKPLPLFGSPRW